MSRGKKEKSKGARAARNIPAVLDPPPRLALLLIAILAFGVYADSLGGDFVFDDTVIIRDNETIRSLDAEHLGRIFGAHYWAEVESRGGLYRPVVMLSYAVNYVLGGAGPSGYHMVNVLLHALNGLLAYALIRELFGRGPLAFLGAVLFVLHPIRTEGVASIVGRAESLAAFFILASWYLYALSLRSGGTPRRLAAAVLFFLATLTKESSFFFPALLPLTDWLAGGDRGRERFGFRPLLLRYLPFALALAASLGLRYLVLGGVAPLYINPSSNPLAGADAWTRFLTATHVLARYLWLLVFPLGLSADYSYDQIPLVTSLLSWSALLPLALLALLAGGTIAARRRAPFLFFCGVVFFVSFLLTSNWIRPIGTIMAERLMYFPSLGFTWALAWLLCEGLKREGWRTRARLAILALVIGYSLRTIDRNLDWRDHYSLFGSAVRTSPRSSLVQANYAAVLLNEKRDFRGAIEHASRAVEIMPEDPSAHFTLAEAYQRIGDRGRAVEACTRVIELAPRTSGGTAALRLRAALRESLGLREEARADYRLLLEWRPNDPAARDALERLGK